MIRSIMFLVFSLVTTLSASAQDSSAERGQEVFQTECARCHISTEMQARLAARWLNQPASALYEQIKATMPAETPGALQDGQYLDVTAYILQIGNAVVPAGNVTAASLANHTITPAAATAKAADEVPWDSYNGNVMSQRYSALDQINADNVADLEIAWRWSGANYGPRPETLNVTTPLMVNGRLFATAGNTRNVVAIDPATGENLWLWRPDEGQRFIDAPRKGSGKGLAYWSNGFQEIVYVITPGYNLVALDATTGNQVADFGNNGIVDLQEGLRLSPDREDIDITLTFPGLVANDVIVVGAAHLVSMRPPSADNVKGDIRGFDARTGKLLWTFKTVPERGEFGYDTWLNGSAEYTGNTGVWAPMSADPELGIVYLPVEAPTGDRYGGDRPGDNLFGNSLVALDIKTGERLWHYQLIHHDIWDWDNPSAPILADLPNGRKVVVQLTKQSWAYVFDRVTGEPIWDIEERPVPATDVPGEWTSPTQPFPTRPAAYDRQGVSSDDLVDFTPEILARAKEAIKPFRIGPIFTPASLFKGPDGTQGTLSLPNTIGGSNWEGGAVDPETGMLYVPSRTDVAVLALVPGGDVSSVAYIQGPARPPSVDGLPIIKPPYGRITAIDLNSGDHVWQIANADTPERIKNHPLLRGVDLPRTGVATRAGLLLTKTLLFAGEGVGGSPVFRAHDKKSGEILAEIELPASQSGTPMTYLHNGKQYIVMSVSGGGQPAEIVALALPD
ncbi:MAG: PQQ-binding-like beta-propeller repeat protein [Pseudomonadales bacterium]|nr:PQQ-binding-like beta-propeller repeat protein [Pseudomonadales bacterium]